MTNIFNYSFKFKEIFIIEPIIPNITTRTINILPDFIANQIAAGEVVQRPESIVKELIENSLDSGADTIGIFIKGAGKALIHIVDNGSGMGQEDLALSIKRHATSKIYTQEDLETIKTFGFRGEALASIGAVADLEIRTKRKSDKIGNRLISEPNKEIKIEPFTTDFGTQIFVRNLFYNVPARRKFLKSDLTEFRHISETVIKFAIANPECRFTFYDNDVLIFDTKPTTLEQRIIEVLGNLKSNNLLEINYIEDGIEIYGIIGKPNIAKSTRTNQYLYLNNRNINSKALNHAVYSCFEHILDKAAHPFYAMFINLDYRKVDVNVHPQKNEVKFEDERKIYSIVKNAINKTLLENNLTFDINITKDLAYSPYEIAKFGDDQQLVNKLTGEIIDKEQFNRNSNSNANFNSNNNEYLNDYSSNNYRSNYNTNKQYPNTNNFTRERENRVNFNSTNNINNSTSFNSNNKSAFDALFGGNLNIPNQNSNSNLHQSQDNLNNENNDSFQFINNIELNDLGFVANKVDISNEINHENNTNAIIGRELGENFSFWLLHRKYIFLENETGLVIIDMHNAHERVLYEKAIKIMNNQFRNNQKLLFPENLELNRSEIEYFKEIENELELLGYEFEITNDEVLVYAVPSDIKFGEQQISINEIIAKYIEYNEIRHTDKRDNIAASFACKAAIKTGYKVSDIEIKQLIIDLFKCNVPYVCPHGRPVILNMTLKDLDSKFKRSS